MAKKVKVLLCFFVAVIIMMAAFLIYILTGCGDWMQKTSYLQSTEQIYHMEAGILYNELDFRDGEDYVIKYDFDNEEYPELLKKYNIKKTAGHGTEYEKALELMNEYADRLYHASDYDNHVDMNAMSLLEYSLDNKSQGINCRSKAQILNEMCLALGIYSRKVWINPNSIYDNECHVVNEIWDSSLNKWVMVDITNNYYWVDKNKVPLSVLEIREHIANQKFCTPVSPDDKLSDLKKSLEYNYANFLYIAKNMVYMQYCTENTLGETDELYSLVPKAYTSDFQFTLISKQAVEASPKK